MTERLTILVDSKGTRIVKRKIRDLAKEAKGAGSNVGFLKKALTGLAVAGAVAALTAAAGAAIELKDALAEVSTLLGDVPGELEELERQTHSLAVEFGSLPTEQARGFYQIISAGARDAAEATDILRASNKLAVGGVTDVATAADGLTTVLNAYGDRVANATAVSDALFVAMKAGKTTIGELSAAIGKVAPLAAQAGVGFDELLASISALTKGGISTRESVTGVRAILAAVVKPTSEAITLAKSLGLEFNAAALESKGLAKFLADVTEKTGGSTAALAQLFGGVEALVPILALTGGAAGDFAQILEDMINKAGATEEAFEKMADSPGFQLGRLLAAMKVEAIKLGNVALPLITSAARFLADNLGTIVLVLKLVVAQFIILKSLNIATSVLATAVAFGRQSAALHSVSLAQGILIATTLRLQAAMLKLNAILLINPFILIATALAVAVALFIQFKDSIRVSSRGLATLGDVAAVVWDRIVSGVTLILNVVSSVFTAVTGFVSQFAQDAIGFFRALFAKVDITFADIGKVAKNIANFLIAVFKSFIDVTIGNFKVLGQSAIAIFKGIASAGKLLSLGIGAAINGEFRAAGRAFDAVFKGRTFDFSAVTATAAETARTVGENFGRDFVGEAANSITAATELVTDAVDGIFDEAEARAQNRAADAKLIALAAGQNNTTIPGTETTVPGGAGAGAGTTGGGSASALEESVSRENKVLAEQKTILESLRQPLEDLNIRKDALKQLLDAGKISSEEFAMAMRDLNVEMSSLDNTIKGGLLNGLARIAQEANNIGEQMSNFVVGAFNKATDAIVEFAKTGEFNVRQFFQDLFAQLLKLAANQLFSKLIGGLLGGGGGGFLSSLFGGGGLPGFATGGEFTVGGDNSATDSQLVAFRATKGEKVTVETPGQQGKGAGGGETIVAPPAQVNVAAVLSPSDIVGAFDNDDGETMIINILQRNSGTVKQIVSG